MALSCPGLFTRSQKKTVYAQLFFLSRIAHRYFFCRLIVFRAFGLRAVPPVVYYSTEPFAVMACNFTLLVEVIDA